MSTSSKTQPETHRFRYNWPVKVSMRQLNPNETIILHISPKFATVYDHISFQWTLKMHGTADDSDEDESSDDIQNKPDYVAISLYYLDGPVSNVELKAKIGILADKKAGSKQKEVNIFEEKKFIRLSRGGEYELSQIDRSISTYIKENIGHVIRLSLVLQMDVNLFKPESYLNAVCPTPFHSFLTANYRARANSKVWKKRSFKRSRHGSDKAGSSTKKVDFEQAFNKVMEEERRWREAQEKAVLTEQNQGNQNLTVSMSQASLSTLDRPDHLFKRLLVACCDSCERRASVHICGENERTISSCEEDGHTTDDKDEHSGIDEDDDENCPENPDDVPNPAFECPEENKAEIHDMLANMYFNKVALPHMEYVEDFADFLIDAELNDLPVLKRACERYLCGELNSKRDLMTSLLLDLLFLAMVFHLPVMKCMTITELCGRHKELENVDELLEQEEYRNLDKRIRQMSDRNLSDLIEECLRFREQKQRVQYINL